MRQTFTAAAVLVALGSACRSPEADILLLNARVYTLTWPDPDGTGTPAPEAPVGSDGWHPDASAVALRDGRVLYVGSDDGARRYQAPHTWVRDLRGATVLPGFVDSHTHVANLGQNLSRVDLRGADTEADVIERVAARYPDPDPGAWIVGYGWDEGAWANRYPTADALSARFPDNPVVLLSLHSFAVWGNRRALESAGITAATASPTGGEILRGPGGRPTGILLNRAGALLTDAVPDPTPEERLAYYHAGLVAMAEAGYVAVHEAGVDAEGMRALQALERGDDLPIRVYALLSARDVPLIREWLARGPEPDPTRRLVTRGVKAFYDGALGSRGARLLEDYADRPGHRGTAGVEFGFDEALMTEAIRGGFQAAVHAIGDAANRETLDFFERVMAEDPAAREGRHRIEHAQVLHPDDIPRFAALGVIASMEPGHAVEDMTWAEERLGPERTRGAYAWRSLRASGARLIFNSDLTGSSHDIFYGLHAALTRRNAEREPASGWYPDQVVTPEEAIRAYTVWPAYAAFAESVTGTLAPGRAADITVMDLDPFVVGTEDPGRLLDGHILLTISAGEVVYDRP